MPAPLAALGLFLAACQTSQPTDASNPESKPGLSESLPSGGETQTDRQTAYRIRSDFDAPLNSETGWAAAADTPAQVAADQPFRIRFEVETGAADARAARYELQYRRNQGAWRPLPAENFPQPAKEVELNFESRPERPLGELWRMEAGTTDALSWQAGDRDGFLRVRSDAGPVLALAQYSAPWEAVEFAAVLRLPSEGGTRAGMVFACQDARNYRRLEVGASGSVALIQVENGRETVSARHQTEPVLDRFFELKLIREGRKLVVEFDDEALVFRASDDTPHSLATLGFHLPEGGRTDFANFVVEGLPRSPRTSITACGGFEHGAPTEDILTGSGRPFGGGAGVSFAETTPAWTAADAHGEWEFPVVIRYFSDEAEMNEQGDVFEYRIVDAAGRPLAAEAYATVSLNVPDGHLGGTFVETPMRIGPWQARDGSLYFLMEPSETWNALMVVKSVDGGRSCREVDGANRPATGDLEGFASRLAGDRIHMLHQTSDEVVYHVFRTADHPQQPDSWAIRDEWLASPAEPPTQVADLAVRSDGSVVAVYGGPEKIHYQTRHPAGGWNDATVIDAGRSPELSGPALVLGADDVVHLAYTGGDGSAWYRRILPDGSITERTQFAKDLGTRSEDVGSILPLVFSEESAEVSILYRTADGFLRERRLGPDGQWTEPVQVTDRTVVQNAVDSDQTGADAIAFGDSVHVLFIEEATGHLYHTARSGDGGWTDPVRLVDDKKVQWVRGARIRGRDGKAAYAYVIDGGADGGSGMNQFGQIPLEGN
ncbi:MAG: hypothetical protein ACOC4K_00080 [Verrucomicrobiota bacterium]